MRKTSCDFLQDDEGDCLCTSVETQYQQQYPAIWMQSQWFHSEGEAFKPWC
ncbi:hypothetical protein DsansV1_C01g0004811 [Dioscorea sansibarensis]